MGEILKIPLGVEGGKESLDMIYEKLEYLQNELDDETSKKVVDLEKIKSLNNEIKELEERLPKKAA